MLVKDLIFTQSTPTARWQSQQLRRPGEPESKTYTVIDRDRDVPDRFYTSGGFAVRLLRNGQYASLTAGNVPGGLDKLELAAFIADMVPVENPKPYRCTGPRGAKNARRAEEALPDGVTDAGP